MSKLTDSGNVLKNEEKLVFTEILRVGGISRTKITKWNSISRDSVVKKKRFRLVSLMNLVLLPSQNGHTSADWSLIGDN